MSDISLVLDDPLGRFVEDQVRSGAYPDAAAVVRAGLDRLRADAEAAEAAKEARYETLLQEGLDQIARGEAIEVTDIGGWLTTLGRTRQP